MRRIFKTSFLFLWLKKHPLLTLIAIGLAVCIYICLEANIYCENHSILCNIKWEIFSNPFVLAIGGLFGWCYIVFQTFIKKQPFNKDTDKNNISDEKVKEMVENFYDQYDIDIVKQYFINGMLKEYIVKTFSNNPDCNGGDDDNGGGGGADNNELYSKETDITIKKQILNAQQNTYNNSYLAFCMLIDRCKTIEFKEDNKYDTNQKPYCFQEIAEAFGLEWKGRRYLRYIAYSVLGNIGELLEKYNKDQTEDSEKIPCVNASVVTKWERDHGNKWFCNGGIKTPAWCCYPPYTSKDGEDDRNFILELCEIVKDTSDKTIRTWKCEYYDLLKGKNGSLKDKTGLDGVYKNYKEKGEEMTYEKIEKLKNDEKI